MSEFDAGASMSLSGGFLKPSESFCTVLTETFAAQVQICQVVFAERIPGFRRLAIPRGGGLHVTRAAETLVVQVTKIGLRVGIAGIGSLLKRAEGLRIVLIHALSLHVEDPEVVVR